MKAPVMNPKTIAMVVGAVLVLAVGASQAQSPNYSFVEGGWWRFDPDGASSEDGLFLGGSAGLFGNFQVFAEIGDAGPIDQWQIGGGWHGLLGKAADLVAQGVFLDNDLLGDGLGVSVGIRWMVLERLELNGFVNYASLDSSETSGELNGIWDFAKRFGVGAGFEGGDDARVLRAVVRFNFGPRQ